MQDEVEAKARELLAAEVSRGQRFDAFLGPVVASEAAIRAIAAAIRQRPIVDDAMVERALDAHIPGGGQVRDFGLPRWAMLAALLAAYQQDNGGK